MNRTPITPSFGVTILRSLPTLGDSQPDDDDQLVQIYFLIGSEDGETLN
jgi:hypothetical protein